MFYIDQTSKPVTNLNHFSTPFLQKYHESLKIHVKAHWDDMEDEERFGMAHLRNCVALILHLRIHPIPPLVIE